MITSNNETQKAPLPARVGLIADADDAERHADAIRACPAFELWAQGGMPQQSALPDVQWYDDTRVLIAQGGIDALVLATSPRDGVRIGEIALDRGVHVWRPPPLGRNFAEAVELARRLQSAEVVCRVASWWQHVGEDIRGALASDRDCEPVFSEVRVSAIGPPLHSWRSSLASAGGGVLTCDAYASLEALVALRDLPESVAGATGKCRRRPSEAPRETEGVANAILRYESGGLGIVSAVWDIPPFGWRTVHHGSAASIRYSADTVALLGANGEVLGEQPLPARFLEAEMFRFAAEIAQADPRAAWEVSINRHLAVSALLEATYLSSRTEQPESPRRLFEVQRWRMPKP